MSVGLSDVETMLTRFVCPKCFHSELEAVLRCDLVWRSCLTTVHCLRCGYYFEPDTERRALERMEARIASGDVDIPCPSCGGRHVRAEFRCDVSSKSCCYFVQCVDCGEMNQVYA
jgi:hypothetical protein